MNHRAIARTLAVMLLVCGTSQAQEYSFRNYGSAEGLNDLSVRAIYQDRVGFLWVATLNGFFRYDGERFEAFGVAEGVPSSPNTAFADAPDGSLLALGAYGLIRLKGNHFEAVQGPFKNTYGAIGIQADGKGHTYIGTDQGLVELSLKPGKDEFALRLIPQATGSSGVAVEGVLVDEESVWYGCGHELCHMDKSGIRVFGRESGLSAHIVVAILKDHAGNLWVKFRDVGVLVLPAGQSQFRRPDFLRPGQILTSIPAIDADGRVLMPMPDGLLIGDEHDWQTIDHTAGLRGVAYTAFEDRQHSLWIGMEGRGLVQWRGYREWENYSTTSGLASETVYEILPQPGGSIWVGTEGGLLRGERQKNGIRWKMVAGLEGISIHSVRAASDGALWLSTKTRGVARLDVHTGKVKWFGEAQGLNNVVFTLCFDRQQRLWAGTEAGLYMAKAPYESFVRISELPVTRIRTIAEGSDGTVWVGGGSGLFSFTGDHWKRYAESDPSKAQVLTLGAGANGTMWVAYRLTNQIDRVHLRPDGLDIEKNVQRTGSNEIAYFMESDAQGRMWVGTDHGVEVLDGGRWNHYVMSDGLVWNYCNSNAFAAERDGTVWIGTSGGLSRFKPRQRYSLDAPIEVVFTKLEMGGTDVSGQNNPSFEMHTNSLVARYSALNATRANAVIFRYRMEGANSAWTETSQRELRLARLAPGDYKLEIEAQDGDGLWRAHRAEFAFRILTPWYRSWWFFTLCGLIPLCVTGFFYRIRMAAARGREHDLQLLVEAQKTIENLAFYDPLTELPNRRMLLDRLRQTLAISARSGRLRALLFVDLDKFKTLNDSFGHQAGDTLLQETARRLTTTVREADTVARLGGDEFVVILEDLSALPEEAAAQAEMIAAKMLAVTSQPYMLAGHECLISSSIGITVFGVQPLSTEEVLHQADTAMYQAKDTGGNTSRLFVPEVQASVDSHAALAKDQRVRIKHDEGCHGQ